MCLWCYFVLIICCGFRCLGFVFSVSFIKCIWCLVLWWCFGFWILDTDCWFGYLMCCLVFCFGISLFIDFLIVLLVLFMMSIVVFIWIVYILLVGLSVFRVVDWLRLRLCLGCGFGFMRCLEICLFGIVRFCGCFQLSTWWCWLWLWVVAGWCGMFDYCLRGLVGLFSCVGVYLCLLFVCYDVFVFVDNVILFSKPVLFALVVNWLVRCGLFVAYLSVWICLSWLIVLIHW